MTGENLCCCSILSKPIISISFPLSSRITRSYSAFDAYFPLTPSRNGRSPSVFFPGRINDPTPGTLLSVLENIRRRRKLRRSHCGHRDRGKYRVEKYFTPLCVPECFPREGSSHSTPSQVPEVSFTGPIYRTVQRN